MAERICMDYEIAKKIVEAGDSKIFKNWHEHTGVSKEDFLAGIEWLCEEPKRYPADHRYAGLLRRELGICKNGQLVHLRRVYPKGLCAFYEDKPFGELWSNGISLSADDWV